ncbi:LytTR family transcriptional regulator [Echinicola marina]|uniref:LytTR family DNA-binding domain-containing protein n=1 Tax=Echinicola marina TaxID=2859768 RepID=UPI001CF66BA8|nr:LytTR family DNA-binding domain-containing protein [Echinicola marina]UCS95053.1 LytTR family transcriptional regulator [Echinicola marina]
MKYRIMEYLILKNELEIAKIPIDAILSLEVNDYLLTCRTVWSRDFCCSKALSEIEGRLPSHFLRINRNTIVNLNKVQLVHFKERTIRMNDQLIYQMSHRKVKVIRKAINEYESNRLNFSE